MEKSNIEKHVYPVRADDLPDIRTKLARISDKASRYGCTLRYEFSDEYLFAITYWDNNTKLGIEHVAAVDCTIESEIVSKGNFEVVAGIEHLEGGNVVKLFGSMRDKKAPDAWYTVEAKCDHCGTNRNRMNTYMVFDKDNGGYKQIGKSCLKDYTGIDPQWIAMSAELYESMSINQIDELAYTDAEHFGAVRSTAFDPVEVVAYAVEHIARDGYIRSSEGERSTKDAIHRGISENEPMENREQSFEKAREIKAWLKNAGIEKLIDSPLRDCKAIMAGTVCAYKHFGYLAYAPLAYEKELERERKNQLREEQRAMEVEQSKYVGEAGQRMEIDIKSCKLLSSWESQFGLTYLYKMVDTLGNVIVWFASNKIAGGFDHGKIKATVKSHEERDGIRQTVVTRCKVCA